jgi:hypothetical protein
VPFVSVAVAANTSMALDSGTCTDPQIPVPLAQLPGAHGPPLATFAVDGVTPVVAPLFEESQPTPPPAS